MWLPVHRERLENGTTFWKVQSIIAPKREVSEIESKNKIDKARTARPVEIEIKFLRPLVVE